MYELIGSAGVELQVIVVASCDVVLSVLCTPQQKQPLSEDILFVTGNYSLESCILIYMINNFSFTN